MKRLFLVLLFLTSFVSAQTPDQRVQPQIKFVSNLPGSCSPTLGIIYGVIGVPIRYYMCGAAGTLSEITGSGGAGAVDSVFGRTGTVVAATNDYTWAQINKSTSSFADITTRSASDISVGILPLARLFGITTSQLSASAGITQGQLAITGTPTGSKFLRDDFSWQTLSGGGSVSNFSAGNLSPLFTTNVADPTTTPALTFTLTNQSANLIYSGPASGGAAAPSFRSLVSNDIPNLAFSKITTGIVPLAQGGTGKDFSGLTNGQILISNGAANLVAAALVAGATNTVQFNGGAGLLSAASDIKVDPLTATLQLGANSGNRGRIQLFGATSNHIFIRPSDAGVIQDFVFPAALPADNTRYLKVASISGSVTTFEYGVPSGGGGSGDVVGPASASDNAIARFDGTTGKLIQNSAITVADTTGNINIAGNPMFQFGNTASAVNYFKFTNSATTGGATSFINTFEVDGSDTNGSLYFKVKGSDVTNGGQILVDDSKRYDRPMFARKDSPIYGWGFKSGGAWWTVSAPNIMLGAGDGTPGLIGLNGTLGFNVNSTNAEDCPACVGVGLTKYSNRVIGVVGADSTPDGDLTHGATFGFIPNTPSQITSSQNNYDPGDPSYFQRWSTDASRQITGMTFAISTKVNGQIHKIYNVGTQDIVFVHESASSTATNRFITTDTSNITLTGGQCASVIYDSSLASARWRINKCEGSSGGGGGTTINPSDNIIPVRTNSTTFGDTNLGYSSSVLTQTLTSLGTTLTESFKQVNTTAAAAGAQQASPAFVQEGQGWKTNATAASQSVKFSHYVLPVQGTANPSGLWKFGASINGGAYSDVLQLASGGQVLTPLGTQAAPGLVIGQSITSTGLFGNGTRIQFSIANSAGALVDTSGIRIRNSERFCFDSTTDPGNGSPDTCVGRNAAGRMEFNNGTNGTYRDFMVRQPYVDQTITAGGTTGNQTINKAAGTVNIAAAGTSVTVTNSLVTTSSLVFTTLRTNDTTCTIKNTVPGSGSFVVNMSAGCAAEVSIGFLVVNQ